MEVPSLRRRSGRAQAAAPRTRGPFLRGAPPSRWGTWRPLLGLAVVAAVYFLEILIDNTFARFRWERAFSEAWIAALVLGGGNLAVLYLTMGG